jgi:hypothetical protein
MQEGIQEPAPPFENGNESTVSYQAYFSSWGISRPIGSITTYTDKPGAFVTVLGADIASFCTEEFADSKQALQAFLRYLHKWYGKGAYDNPPMLKCHYQAPYNRDPREEH